MTIIRTYKNGNYRVALHYDGTKERIGEEPHIPVYPESIDLKITDKCECNCPYCHEKSTPEGKHAIKEDIYKLFSFGFFREDGLPGGVEIAIGGGNPLLHPDLLDIIRGFNCHSLVPSITVKYKSLQDVNFSEGEDREKIVSSLKRCYGIGLSSAKWRWREIFSCPHLKNLDIRTDNVVLHSIAGINNPLECIGENKILILGFKDFGRGENIDKKKVEKNIMAWRYWLPVIIKRANVVSFDNLALEQLDVRNLIGEEAWSKYYMGDDGDYTMYIDAVKMEYAVSSTSERHKIPEGSNVVDLFKKVRELKRKDK